jgi:hypothetical protein
MMIDCHPLAEELFCAVARCHHLAGHLMPKDYRRLCQPHVYFFDVSGAQSASLNLNQKFTLADFRYRYGFDLYPVPSPPYTSGHFSRNAYIFHWTVLALKVILNSPRPALLTAKGLGIFLKRRILALFAIFNHLNLLL